MLSQVLFQPESLTCTHLKGDAKQVVLEYTPATYSGLTGRPPYKLSIAYECGNELSASQYINLFLPL